MIAFLLIKPRCRAWLNTSITNCAIICSATFQPTPLRINRQRQILEKILFTEFFKQCSLRVKFLSENYGHQVEYDYQTLMAKTENIRIVSENLWRHNFERWTNRRSRHEPLDGMLGEIEYGGGSLKEFLPFVVAGSILHIGNSTSFGLGQFKIDA